MRRRLSSLTACFTATLALVCGTTAAHAQELEASFGPLIGVGQISSGADVKSAMGYGATLARTFPVLGDLSIGPVLQFANTIVKTEDHQEGGKVLGTYDNRLFAGGIQASYPLGTGAEAPSLYVSGLGGRGYSKLELDDSTASAFAQGLYGNISGNYFAGEIGTLLRLKGELGVTIAYESSIYRADQSQASGSLATETTDQQGSIYLASTGEGAGQAPLTRHVVMRTQMAKIGLRLGF